MYRVKSWMILTGLVGLFAMISYLLFDWTVALLVLGFSIFMNRLSVGYGVPLILKMHRARLLNRRELPELHAIAAQLAQKAGISIPHLAYYPSDMPNAFALDGGPGKRVVAVSSALFNLLTRREMTGVLAHEFAHLKNKDSRMNLSAGMFVQMISTMTMFAGIVIFFMIITGAWTLTGTQMLLLMGIVWLAPYAATALQAALSREREWLADYEGSQLTDDPQGLASALYRMHRYTRSLARYLRRFQFIYTVDLESGPEWLRTHPSTERRIEALLKREQPEQAPSLPYRATPGQYRLRYVA